MKGNVKYFSKFFSSDINCCNCKNRNGKQEDEQPPLDQILPPLLHQMNEVNLCNTKALKCVYQLCNENNGENRIAMLCCRKWDVLTPLLRYLRGEYDESSKGGNGRHLACLTLANLSIPFENKAVLALGNDANSVFSALYGIIQRKLPEAYLSCICLVNIAFLEDAAIPLFMFSPQPSLTNISNASLSLSPLQNSLSACRILETLIRSCIYPPIKATVQSEAVRWACVLLKNITSSRDQKDICSMILKTRIPLHIVGYLSFTKASLNKWVNESVEDSSLQIILNLCKWSESKTLLNRLNTCQILRSIIGQGGIHDYRASAIVLSLES